MHQRIPLASLGLRKKDIQAATQVLNSNNLTMGNKVKEFETAMAEYLKVSNFIMVNSGSSANLAIIEALMRPVKGLPKLKVGDGVLVPAVAWPTTVWPLIQLGLLPVFVDVNSKNLAIDLDLAEYTIQKNPGVKAIFAIHPLGYAIDPVDLNKLCEKFSLIQINDVCESLGSWRNQLHAGTSGIASSYSFYFSHHITTMEGGGIATNDTVFADNIRAIRSHGWSRDRTDVLKLEEENAFNFTDTNLLDTHSKFLFVGTGFNIRPMEIQAAIGIEQLKDLEIFIQKRRKIARELKETLSGTAFEVIDAGTLDNSTLEKSHSWMLIAIRINLDMNKIRRNLLNSMLVQFGIESRPVLTGNFLNQPAMKKLGVYGKPQDFPNAQLVSSNYFMVGCHHDLGEIQIKHLAYGLRSIAQDLISI